MYNLRSNQADRIRFDEMIRRHAEAALQSLSKADALKVDPAEYAALQWEAEAEYTDTDDIQEAEARWSDLYPAAVSEWQAENR
jgi:hypothetical protein